MTERTTPQAERLRKELGLKSTALTANTIPFSSVVGGGVQLVDGDGHPRFQVVLIGTTNGITKEENRAIATRLAELINEHGLEVPAR